MHHDAVTPAGASEIAARPSSDKPGPASEAAPLADAPPAPSPDPHAGEPVSADEVRAALRRVKDPELNLNIVDLGLIYDIKVDGSAVTVDMSLTSPGCPSGPEIMRGAEDSVKSVPGVSEATVNLVWSPIWTPERIEPRVRSYLGF